METNRTKSVKKVVLVITSFLFCTSLNGQYCDSITPSMNVDLSASPNLTWTSPLVARNGNCCGTSNPDKCLEFVITLNPDAIAVSFNIASGAVPPGALFYQIDCGPATPVGAPICLSGVGPHHLTFCKPGNNSNSFSITSYSEPIIGPDMTLNSGCTGFIYANYYNEPSMTWTSIFPGPNGAYNSYLDCTSGCDTVNVTAPLNAPAFVDYLVCGTDIGGCNPLPFCDTIRVNFVTPVTVTVSPDAQHLCFGAPMTNMTATASGGTPPYSYSWNTGAVTPSITAGAGTYIVNVTDSSGCIVASDTAVITQDVLPIVANAGPDQVFCSQNPVSVLLNGVVQTASGGSWSGGSGSFAPSNTDLNATYTPTATEIANGSVTLELITTGNNGCPADTDQIVVSFVGFSEVFALSTIDVSCNGANDGEAHISVSGLYAPATFSWDGAAITSDTFALNLIPGQHQVQIINSLGCDSIVTFMIAEPSILNLVLDNTTDVSCHGGNNGSASVTANGGTPGYTYNWNTVPAQWGQTATGLTAGNYSCMVTDSNGCTDMLMVNIQEPTALSNVFGIVDPACYGSGNGAVSTNVSGGIAPYTFSWSNGSIASDLYNLTAGTYDVTITDSNGCQLTDQAVLTDPAQLTVSITPDHIICPNASTTITVTPSGGTGNYFYSWNPGGMNTASVIVSPLNNQSYSCTISDNNNCSVNVSCTITVNYLNPSDLSAFVSSTTICENDSISLSAIYSGADTSVILQWMHCPLCPVDQPVWETPDTDTFFVVMATNSCGEVIYDTVFVHVNEIPFIDLAPVFGTICPGGTVSFENNGSNSPVYDYLWSFGDGYTSNESSPSHIYENDGNYPVSLTITDDNGCTNSLSGTSFVIVNPQADASFTATSYVETTLDPEFHFENHSSNASSFIWNFGDGTSSVLTHPTHEYEGYGTFIVTLVANNMYNCPDSTFIPVEVKPSFEIFVPNAFTPDGDSHNNTFFAKGYGISDKDYTLYIFNRWGDLIFEAHNMEDGWDGTISADGKKAQDDVYTWVVYFRDLTDKKHKMEGHVSLLK